MIFYHGTSEAAWRAIQTEGALWGGCTYHKTKDPKCYRYTYLTPELEVAQQYGTVVLEVKWDPEGVGSGVDNYGFNPPPRETCWQFSVFVPITLDRVRRVQ